MADKAWQNWRNGFNGKSSELQPLQSEEEGFLLPSKYLSQATESTLSSRSDASAPDAKQPQGDEGCVERLSNYLSPPHVPEEVQLLRWENLAIPVCYLVVGTLQGLFRTFLNVYPLSLGATEAQQTTLSTIATIPAAFKMLYGFATDNLPLFGYRRKPYLFLGWFMTSFMMFLLLSTSDLTLGRDPETGHVIPPPHAPTMTWLGVTFFLFGISMWFADATADALVAEKARCEPPEQRGALQSTCYACRFFGLMVMAPLSSYLYTHVGPKIVVQLLMAVPTVMFPLSYILKEERNLRIASFRDQCHEIWITICSRSVWEPMAFIYLFHLFQIPNAAWKQFLRTVYNFTDAELNALLVVSYTLLYVGTMVYKFCFLKISWRFVYFGCLLTNGFFSGLQLLLVRGYTFGLDPFVFALGDDAMSQFIQGIQFLPSTILMVALTPEGSEGAAYAMFTTVSNAALESTPQLATLMLGIWDTSAETMEAGDLDGLFKLSILTTVLQMMPLLFLGLMPHDRDSLYALSKKAGSGHPLGGAIFLTILVASMTWMLVIAILNIVDPGWAGGS